MEFFDTVEQLLESYEDMLVAAQDPLDYDGFSSTVPAREKPRGLIPSREAYSQETNTVDEINSVLGGEGLFVCLGLDMDLPYFHELDFEEYVSEGNWWDNAEEIEADILMDRPSYEGAVRIPPSRTVEVWRPRDFSDYLYFSQLK